MNSFGASHWETCWISTNLHTWDLLIKHLQNPKIKTCTSAGKFQKSITQRLCPPSWVCQEISWAPACQDKISATLRTGTWKKRKANRQHSSRYFFNIFQILLKQKQHMGFWSNSIMNKIRYFEPLYTQSNGFCSHDFMRPLKQVPVCSGMYLTLGIRKAEFKFSYVMWP